MDSELSKAQFHGDLCDDDLVLLELARRLRARGGDGYDWLFRVAAKVLALEERLQEAEREALSQVS